MTSTGIKKKDAINYLNILKRPDVSFWKKFPFLLG